MNLSEIRKKAQQEKEESNGGNVAAPIIETPAPLPVTVEPVETVQTIQAVPEGPLRQDLVEKTPSFILTEPTSSQPFDPLSVILAGRLAARGDDGTESAFPAVEIAGEEFQELLCFRVAGEKYAVDIMEIKEIIKPREVTEVPRVPSYVSGVLSLRGIIIPVIDMHSRLGHDVAEGSGRERIIVVKKGEEFFGIMVDEVIQVVRIAPEGIEPPPAVLDEIDRDFVSGIGRFDGEMLILLSLGKVLEINLQ